MLKSAGFADAVHVGGGVIGWVNQIEPEQAGLLGRCPRRARPGSGPSQAPVPKVRRRASRKGRRSVPYGPAPFVRRGAGGARRRRPATPQISPLRVRWLKASQPGSTGSQKVSSRKRQHGGRGDLRGRARRRSGRPIRAASTAPTPPGVGAAEPSALPARKTTAMLA